MAIHVDHKCPHELHALVITGVISIVSSCGLNLVHRGQY